MNVAIALLGVLLLLLFAFAAFAFIRGMNAAQRQFDTAFSQWLERQKFSPAVVVIGTAALAVAFNAKFLELLIFGRSADYMKPIDGFTNLQSYWFDVVALGVLSLVIDIKIALFFRRRGKNKNKA